MQRSRTTYLQGPHNPLLHIQTAPAVLILLALLALPGCRGADSETTAGTAGTPVIIISIDTLRSDRLPAYGYEGVETPAIDAFRKDSILYESAWTHCPLTLPAHASLFTGLLPADHGIRDNLGYRLNPDVSTIAEVLGREGYATGAAVSAFVLRTASGIARGFDHYDDQLERTGPDQVIGNIQRAGAETVALAENWISQQKDRPFFYTLHVYEPHTPYTPPEPYRSRYASAYDGEIAHTDAIIGNFLDFLQRTGIYDRALIILLSDHGEGLGDHGEDEHGIFLYREAIQIPLMVKLPRNAHAGSSVPAPVQLVDVFPTIVQQTASKADVSRLPGTSLLAFVKDDLPRRMIYSETYYPRFHFGWSDLHSLTDGVDHFIEAPRPELYSLVSDPGETKNVMYENRRTFSAMRKAIEPLMREPQAPSDVDPEEAAKLAALGYLGGGSDVGPRDDLPDPKDKISTFPAIKTAFTYYKEGEYEKAIAAVDALLSDNPRMLDLWDMKARSYEKMGRFDAAIDAAKEGLKLSPNSTPLAVLVANLSLQIGRMDEAIAHADLVLSQEPPQGHEILARIALERGDLAAASEHAREAMKADEHRIAALMTLARVEKKRENLQASLTYLDQAIELLGKKGRPASITNLHFLRGDTLARLGRTREAEASFRREIEHFPEEPHAYKNLILLYVTEGRTQEATRLVFELIEASPTPRAYLAVVETLATVGDERGARYWARKGREAFPRDPSLRQIEF